MGTPGPRGRALPPPPPPVTQVQTQSKMAALMDAVTRTGGEAPGFCQRPAPELSPMGARQLGESRRP